MDIVSIWQWLTWNSEWRRRAPVSNWACMRLESAMRTPIASEVAADDAIIRMGLPRPTRDDAAIVGSGRTVHKETGHKISLLLSKREWTVSCRGNLFAKNCAVEGRNSLLQPEQTRDKRTSHKT